VYKPGVILARVSTHLVMVKPTRSSTRSSGAAPRNTPPRIVKSGSCKLQAELKRLGLSTAGSKDVLQNRLDVFHVERLKKALTIRGLPTTGSRGVLQSRLDLDDAARARRKATYEEVIASLQVQKELLITVGAPTADVDLYLQNATIAYVSSLSQQPAMPSPLGNLLSQTTEAINAVCTRAQDAWGEVGTNVGLLLAQAYLAYCASSTISGLLL
jgi:hypothetical protein